ncbi:MAG: sugar ABC transporter substrate-binding protein [Dermabacter sp.]|nr:sugar ABC transporter substrate-binding protein [Dermabacter sp.]
MSAMSRRVFGTVALGSTVGLAAACGRSDTGPSTPGTAQPIADGAATGTLNVWAMGTEGEKLPALLKDFEKDNPDVSITVTPVPWDSAHDKFTSAIAAGTVPDVAQVGSTWMSEFVSLGALQVTPDEIDLSGYFEGARDAVAVQGVNYGVPWYVETRVVYYRKDLAEQAGFTEPPTDWEGLFAMAKAMKEQAGARWGISLQPGGTGAWQTTLPLMWSNGGGVVSEDGSEFTFDTAENQEALAYYQSFFTDEVADKSPADGTTETDFASGTVPMFISGPWMMSSVEAAGGDGFADKYGVFTMPTKVTSSSFLGGANLGVFEASKNRDAAWKLVQYLSRPEVQVEWFALSTDLPAVQSAWDDPSVTKNEKFAVFHTQLETAIAPPMIATWEQVAEKFDAQTERVCKQALDVSDALATSQSEADAIGTGA